jgi:hypothetical protein
MFAHIMVFFVLPSLHLLSVFAADGIATSYTMTAKAYIRSLVSTTISSDTVIYPCSYLTPGNSKYYTCPASGLYTFDLSYTLPDSNLWSSTGETIQVSVKLKSQDQGVSNTKCIMYLKPQGASSYGMYTSTAGASVLVLGAAAVYFGKARKCLSIDQEEEEEEAVEPQAINFEMMGGPSTHVRFEEKV